LTFIRGAVLYECATGRRHSWTGPDADGDAVLTDDPCPKHLHPKAVKRFGNDPFESAEKLPKRRYASAQALAEAWNDI